MDEAETIPHVPAAIPEEVPEGVRRKLRSLERAYGEVIRSARSRPGVGSRAATQRYRSAPPRRHQPVRSGLGHRPGSQGRPVQQLAQLPRGQRR